MKTPEQIINLHPYPSILDDIIYCSWDVECDRLKLVIMGHILPFYASPPPKKKNPEKSEFWKNEKKKLPKKWPLTLLTTQKMKILKKWEKHLEILPPHTCVPQMTIIWCMVS